MGSTRFTELVGIEHPVVQAPMAGCGGAELAVAVSEAGGLGSLPCALLTPDGVRDELGVFRQRSDCPVNVNFFCHASPAPDEARIQAWNDRLAGYFRELKLDPPTGEAGPPRLAFDEAMAEVLEDLRPPVVSFHFGLPAPALLERVRATGAVVMSSATTVDEARWLEDHGCDVVIAQGVEAGGHRAMFLTGDVTSQIGTMALVPQVADAVAVPVVAAGGIGDGRGVAAALALGAEAAQLGTAFLLCPEATTGPLHREAISAGRDRGTALTNVFTGRPARAIVNRAVAELGPMSDTAPDFPLAATAMGPLRASAEGAGSSDFTPLWSGQAAGLARAVPAGALVRQLAEDAERHCTSR